ncbi:MAG: hypothetical protein Q4C70_01275 [Planctomycetia bacterium]|nr:hypothetical protein [Planctomycetia bacterium]
MSQKLALKLLFQFRIPIDGDSGVYRRCEERYVMLNVQDGEDINQVIDQFYKKIKKEDYVYQNTNGDQVFFEFVGVMDYIVWDYREENEFWYDYRTRKLPMENKTKLTLSKRELKQKIANSEKAGGQLSTWGRRFNIQHSFQEIEDDV